MTQPSIATGLPAAPALIVVATCFNVALCFINTRHWAAIGPQQIIAVSLAILLAGAITVRKDVDASMIRACMVATLAIVACKLFNPALDLKILFDVAIAPVFFLLGRRSSLRAAERVLMIVLGIVVAVGLMELALPDQFQNALDILGFYTSKGAMSPDVINYGGTSFFASAERSEAAGRTLLPQVFGPHRVSSIFLEPVSMGNFPLICLAWLLSVPRRWDASRWMLALGTALCIVLPDSRLAAGTSMLMLLARATPWHGSRMLAAALPIATLCSLVLAGLISLGPGEQVWVLTDDLQGRSLFSGKLLSSWGWAEWFALEPSAVYTLDTGYAYLMNNLGLPLTLWLWLRVAGGPPGGRSAGIMQMMLAIYAATSLCVGASMFSLKTAALLWFLFGATQPRPADAPA
jgi:putative polymerase